MSELDEIRSILRDVALQQREASERMTRIEQVVESNARAVEANSNAISELRQENAEMRVTLREEVESVVQMITDLGEYVGRQAEQAERDRVEFRATVQGILDALTQRFSGNGHGES